MPEHLLHNRASADITSNPVTALDANSYDRFSPNKKKIILAVLSYSAFISPMSSTTILSGIPEIAADYSATPLTIEMSNALYILAMGIAPVVWAPLSSVYGRRWVYLVTATLYLAFSIATALAPNTAAFITFRILSGLQGTSFQIIGSSSIGDIYPPSTRSTAMAWFLTGILLGPAVGPLIGGAIVTYTSWRMIFWLQSGLTLLALLLIFWFVPETIPIKKSTQLEGLTRSRHMFKVLSWINPVLVLKLQRYPNLSLTNLAAGAINWNMFVLLTGIRHVLNPRFHLTSPLQAGLFYLAPGAGYLFGSVLGGRYADYTANKWQEKRQGKRIPEDRLRSSIISIGMLNPACMIVYGWSVQKSVGGIPLPVIAMFLQAVAQLLGFPALNTYGIDVARGNSAEMVAGSYLIRYSIAAVGSAVCNTAIDGMGVGWFSTLSAGMLMVSAGFVWVVAIWGEGWRENVDEKVALKAQERERKEVEKGQGKPERLESIPTI
ncbi:hypothetical protein MMC14_007221 [Varicellaria rhodocarpa]|nr:hypothetical protein [Varicellaria rhodocarpa]